MITQSFSTTALWPSLSLAPTLLAEMLPHASSPPAESAKHDKQFVFVGDRFAHRQWCLGEARGNDQPPVSEGDFHEFLDGTITPAFPGGMTLLTGLGQFCGVDDIATEESSFLARMF